MTKRYLKDLFSDRLKKYLLITAGSLSLGIGIIGLFVPVMPTTPFLLLSAACYVRSSQRLYDWLMNHRLFGKHLREYVEKKTIPLRVKILALCVLWLTLGSTIIFIIHNIYLKLVLAAIGLAVSIHISRIRTSRRTGRTQ